MTASSAPLPSPTRAPWRERYRRAGRETGFLLAQLPIAIAAFGLGVLVPALGVPLAVVAIGVVVVAALLAAIHGVTGFSRDWMRRLGFTLAHAAPVRLRLRPGDAVTAANGWRRAWSRLRHGQSWMDLVGVFVWLPLAITTFATALVWWVASVAAMLYWFWSRYLPEEGRVGLATFLRLPTPEWALNLVLGAIGLLVAPAVIRLLTMLQVWWQQFLLLPSRSAALQGRVDNLTASRAAVVGAEAQALRRLERDLHDGPQQRLVRTTMDMQAARRRLDAGDLEGVRQHLESALAQVESGLGELRTLSRGIAPPVLADRGLHAAIMSLAGQSAIPVSVVDDEPGARYGPARENAAYFVVSESLANAAKHSGATAIQVALHNARDGILEVSVSDDGVGGAHAGKGHGLAGLQDRLAGVDGVLELDSPDGGGTVIRALIP